MPFSRTTPRRLGAASAAVTAAVLGVALFAMPTQAVTGEAGHSAQKTSSATTTVAHRAAHSTKHKKHHRKHRTRAERRRARHLAAVRRHKLKLAKAKHAAQAHPVRHAAAATPTKSAPKHATTATTTTTTTPGPSNTGVPAGTKLTRRTGYIVVTQAGAVISGIDLYGRITVKAPNVTIKNSIIRIGNDGVYSGIQSASTGLKVQNVEITAQAPHYGTSGVSGSGFTLERVNIHGLVDGANFAGSNIVIKDSWLHNNVRIANDPQHNGGPSHDDSVQITGGSNITIAHNYIDGAGNAGMQITQDRSVVSNVVFRDNIAGGGGCTVNIAESGKGPIKGISVTNNRFLADQTVRNCAIALARTTAISNVNNVWASSGTAVKVVLGR